MVTIFTTPQEMAMHIAATFQEKRLSLNVSQKNLSLKSGVSLGTLKKFEQTGKISLESLLKLALAVGTLESFSDLFTQNLSLTNSPLTLDDLLTEKKRKRGRT